MSLLLKAFPHGRPTTPARTSLRVLATVLATLVALLAALLPLAGTASAASPSTPRVHHPAKPTPHHEPGTKKHHKPSTRKHHKPSTRKHHQPSTRKHHKPRHHKPRHQKPKHHKPKQQKPRKPAKPKAPPKPVGQPPRSYVVPETSYFSYPNLGKLDRQAIRARVLKTINSTWGGRRTSIGTPRPENGSIRIATWSFDDWDVAHALVAARKRGVSVQVIAARQRNQDHGAWRWLRDRLGQKLARPGYPATRDTVSFARVCRGACRGPGGTAHAKYFLFKDVGAAHVPTVTFQTSMNLTYMAWQGQWNQAQVSHAPEVYADFLGVFDQARLGHPVRAPYHVKAFGKVVNYFFPRPHATAAQDPAMQILNLTRCQGSTTPSGKTKIRVNQYAIYGDRGVWLAKKLRALWKAGCDVAIIYSVSSRPVMSILRNPTGRGPIPMRQSVVTDSWGNILKYDHSKWMTIIGSWGPSRASYQTFSGSANWANLAFGDDEQMQRISSVHEALRYNASFAKTWRQESSDEPSFGRVATFGRGRAPNMTRLGLLRSLPEDEPEFGKGIYRYMTPD